MGFKLELGPEPRTAGSFFSFPCEKTEDTLVFVSWVLGMQNTFSNGRKFFFPPPHPPFVMVVRFPGQATKAYLPQP